MVDFIIVDMALFGAYRAAIVCRLYFIQLIFFPHCYSPIIFYQDELIYQIEPTGTSYRHMNY